MARKIGTASRNNADFDRLTWTRLSLLVVPAAIVSCLLVLAVAYGTGRDVALLYSMSVILLSGLLSVRRLTPSASPRLPGWFVWKHAMSVPIAMLIFAAVLPLLR
jgi:hypothetical protein